MYAHRRIEIGRIRTQFQRFGSNFADRWLRWTGSRLIKVRLHSKSFGGALKWLLKGGSRSIEVAATAGLTVVVCCMSSLSWIFFCIFTSSVNFINRLL